MSRPTSDRRLCRYPPRCNASYRIPERPASRWNALKWLVLPVPSRRTCWHLWPRTGQKLGDRSGNFVFFSLCFSYLDSPSAWYLPCTSSGSRMRTHQASRERGETTMRTVNWKGAVARSLLGLAALLVVPMVGATPAMAEKVNPSVGAVLYEGAEDAYFLDANGMPTGDPDKIVLRVATAQLTSWVELGTPLCPSEFLLVYPKAKRCALNAIGTDYVSLQGDQPGTGPVSGVFSVVIQGDNPTDGPEGVALTGTFTGTVDLSLALAGA